MWPFRRKKPTPAFRLVSDTLASQEALVEMKDQLRHMSNVELAQAKWKAQQQLLTTTASSNVYVQTYVSWTEFEQRRRRAAALEPATPVEELDLVVGPIVGWRSWTLTKDGFLASLNTPTVWLPKQRMECFCRLRGTHQAPHRACSCGIYAWKGEPASEHQLLLPNVFGTVSLWGRVERHNKGWRAQYAYPKELFIADYNKIEVICAVAYRYGIETVIR